MRGFAVVAFVLLVATPALADPKAECIAAADQAQQARDDGRYRAARDAFATCSRAVCPKPVAASCTKWSREIDDAMPTLVLAAKDPSGADVTDARVTFDGAVLATTLDGKPVAVDPGSHKLRFEREGSDPVEQTVVVKAGEKLRAISVMLRPTAPVETTEPPHAPHKDTGPSNVGRTVATVALGVIGVGGLAAGMVFAFASDGDSDSAAKLRGAMPANACTGTGAMTANCQALSSAVSAENRDGTLSVVTYITGGVFAAAAVVTWFVWPKSKTEKPPPIALHVAPTFFGISGSF
jgi:hypothetical protein